MSARRRSSTSVSERRAAGRGRLLLPGTVFVIGLVGFAACDENPPESAYDTPTPEPSPSPGVTPVAVAIPQDGTSILVAGAIEAAGERDVFTFNATSGDRVRIDVDAQGMNPSSASLDAVLTLYGTDGVPLAVVDDGTNFWDSGTTVPGALRDPYLVATAPANGEYTVVLEDKDGNGDDNSEFDYEVSFSLVLSTALNGGISCAEAVPIGPLPAGGAVLSLAGSIDGASTDSCCDSTPLPCVGGTVPGRDVLYKATFTAGERVQITRTGPADGAVYVTTDCVGNSPSSIIDSCEAGADGSEGADGVVFTPLVTGTYFLHVDSVTSTNGLFTLDVRSIP